MTPACSLHWCKAIIGSDFVHWCIGNLWLIQQQWFSSLCQLLFSWDDICRCNLCHWWDAGSSACWTHCGPSRKVKLEHINISKETLRYFLILRTQKVHDAAEQCCGVGSCGFAVVCCSSSHVHSGKICSWHQLRSAYKCTSVVIETHGHEATYNVHTLAHTRTHTHTHDVWFNDIGINTVVVPIYISEISPIRLRGSMGVCHQMAITITILLSEILGLDTVCRTNVMNAYHIVGNLWKK